MFFPFFAIIYSELSQKNIFTCTYLYFFGDILHILWSKNKDVDNMLLLESLQKKSIITNFLILWPKICKMLPNRIENMYKNILFWYFTVKYWKKWKNQLLSIFAPNMVVNPPSFGARSLTNVKLDLRVTCSFKNINF